MSLSRVMLLAGILSMMLWGPENLHAQGTPESYIAVIGRPGVVGAPDLSPGGEKAASDKEIPKLGATSPLRMKVKETVSVPDKGVVSLLVFSRQHDAGKTAQGSINLKPGTKATIDPAAIDKDDDVLLDLEKGSVQVIKEPKSKGVFRVRTPQATMAVRGTEVWLKHEPAADGKHARTVCAVPSGTVEAIISEKKVLITAGHLLEIEDGKAKPAVKITPDLQKTLANFRYEPTPEKWLILDSDDDSVFSVNLRPRFESSVFGTTNHLISDKEDKLLKYFQHSTWVPTQLINVSAYRYVAVLVRIPQSGALSLRMWDIASPNRDDLSKGFWYEGIIKTPNKNKWQWFIFNLDQGAKSDTRLLGMLELNRKPESDGTMYVQMRQIMFLCELPSSMKDRVYQDKKPSP